MLLTDRQKQVLDYVRQHAQAHGLPPTRSEIAAALGFRSVNAAEQHLRALARKGALSLLPGASRGICLRPEAGLPCVSGLGTSSDGASAERFAMDGHWFRPGADCLLCYEGQNLLSLGIMRGDWLALARGTAPEHGQLVLVRLRGQLTVKRYRRKGERAYLVSDAADSAAFVVSGRDDARIEGLVVGVLRRYTPPAAGDEQ